MDRVAIPQFCLASATCTEQVKKVGELILFIQGKPYRIIACFRSARRRWTTDMILNIL